MWKTVNKESGPPIISLSAEWRISITNNVEIEKIKTQRRVLYGSKSEDTV